MLKKFRLLYIKTLKMFINNKVEDVFVVIFALLFITLLLAQIALTNDTIRVYLSNVEDYEGYTISDIDNLIKEGSITLELMDMSRDNDVKVLVNGKEKASFDKKAIDINVTDNSVVEIDGSKIKTSFRVKVIDKSSNVEGEIVNSIVLINSNIKTIARIKLK